MHINKFKNKGNFDQINEIQIARRAYGNVEIIVHKGPYLVEVKGMFNRYAVKYKVVYIFYNTISPTAK